MSRIVTEIALTLQKVIPQVNDHEIVIEKAEELTGLVRSNPEATIESVLDFFFNCETQVRNYIDSQTKKEEAAKLKERMVRTIVITSKELDGSTLDVIEKLYNKMKEKTLTTKELTPEYLEKRREENLNPLEDSLRNYFDFKELGYDFGISDSFAVLSK